MTRYAVRPGASNDSVAPLGFTDDIASWDGGTFANVALGPNGTVNAPTYSFSNDPDLGIYRVGANSLGIAVGAGVNGMTFSNSLVQANLPFFTSSGMEIGDGSSGAPSLRFNNDTNTGFWRPGNDRLGVITGGGNRWEWDASGHFLAATDNTYNIGAAGANRPATIEVATKVKLPAGSAAAPSVAYNADTANGLFFPAIGQVGLAALGVEALRVDGSAVAGNTRLLVYDVDNATLERVTVGAADSGGAGFKLLRIPN